MSARLSRSTRVSDVVGPLNSQTNPISKICVAFCIFVVDKQKDFIFGVQIEFQPMDDKPS